MRLTIDSPAERETIIRRMASAKYESADYLAIHREGQIEGWVDDDMANWLAYLPSCGRAVWVTNGDPVWFDASSLDDAVQQVQSGAEIGD